MWYRIIKDWCWNEGYRYQVWRWWFPFWVEPIPNHSSTPEGARDDFFEWFNPPPPPPKPEYVVGGPYKIK